MKQVRILWVLLLLCAFTACSSGSAEIPITEMEEYGPVEAETTPEFFREPPRILPKEAVEYANRKELSSGFVLAEREEDGKLFLEFTRPDVPEFSLRINQKLTEAVAVYQGKTMVLERVETPNEALYDWYVSAGYGGPGGELADVPLYFGKKRIYRI